jgi:tRNA/tmRNA/rRNA uracil-C5-methylase (TrmA/RlmC/RlmD family)
MCETIDLEIVDVGYGGKGVARHEGCVYFVPGVLVGEKVRASVTRRHKRYVDAELVEVLCASPHRVVPSCPLVDQCPGCSYQHASYEEELRIKQAQLCSLLERVGHVSLDKVKPPSPAPQVLGYRNKIKLHCAPAHAQPAVGYVGRDNVSIVDVPACELARKELNASLAEIRNHRKDMLEPGAKLTIRHTEDDGVKVWTGKRPAGGKRLTESTLIGPLHVPPESFFQVNPEVADQVLEQVMEMIRSVSPERFVDLYCGVGVFALAASTLGVPHVTGVDSDRAAVRAAYDNAMMMNMEGLEFIHADVSSVLHEVLVPENIGQTMMLLDPSRRGVSRDVLNALVDIGPGHIVYVSCAADTLARDLDVLGRGGYAVESVQLFDMFPRTALFETLAWLKT